MITGEEKGGKKNVSSYRLNETTIKANCISLTFFIFYDRL